MMDEGKHTQIQHSGSFPIPPFPLSLRERGKGGVSYLPQPWIWVLFYCFFLDITIRTYIIATMEKQGGKYQTIYETIRKEIFAGRYAHEEKLPSENDLCRRFKTSRITAGRVFRMLERDGLVRRHQGKGSFVNYSARGHAVRGDTVAMVLHTLKYFHAIVEDLSRRLEREGVNLKLLIPDYDNRSEFAAFGDEAFRKVIFNPKWTAHEIFNVYPGALKGFEDKVIVVNKRIEGFGGTCVYPDEVEAGRLVASFFADKGCRSLGYYSIYPDFHFHVLRLKGLTEGARERNLSLHVMTGSLGMGETAALRDWVRRNSIDSIITDQPAVASGLIAGLSALDLRVPEHIKMAIFAEDGTAGIVRPPLTLVDRATSFLSETLFNLVTGKGDYPRLVRLPLTMKEDASTGGKSQIQIHPEAF